MNRTVQSITDTAQQLIHLVCYRFGLAPYKVMWIEHYPPGGLKKSETYDLITLALGEVTSQRVSLYSLEGCVAKNGRALSSILISSSNIDQLDSFQ